MAEWRRGLNTTCSLMSGTLRRTKMMKPLLQTQVHHSAHLRQDSPEAAFRGLGGSSRGPSCWDRAGLTPSLTSGSGGSEEGDWM